MWGCDDRDRASAGVQCYCPDRCRARRLNANVTPKAARRVQGATSKAANVLQVFSSAPLPSWHHSTATGNED